MTLRALLPLVWLAATANAAPSSPEAPRTPGTFEEDMMVRFHMHENLDLMRAIEKLLVHNHLEPATSLARAIAQAPDEANMGEWSVYATAVRDRAAQLAASKTIEEATKLDARLAIACAGCHVEAGVSPEFKATGKPPPDKATVEARMARHLWATDRLWEGIVGGDDDTWKQGLAVLAAPPLSALSKAQQPFAKRLREIAKTPTPTLDDKATVYGKLLATCAGCHAAK